MLHRLRDELCLDVTVVEKADDVGGTWYWNRYPGARCDSESHIYCYSFDEELLEEWEWTERYPEQPEILEYLRFAADHLDLRRDIEFGTEVTEATFDEDSTTWLVETDDGETVRTRFFIPAVGSLSEPYLPDFDGRESFEGEWYHTSRWPHEGVDLEGERVGVIGTGSTGIQAIPEVAERAHHLTVFQRTPNYVIPARNRPLSEERYAEIRENYDEIWEEAHASSGGMPFEYEHETAEELPDEVVEETLEERWQRGGFRFLRSFEDLVENPETNEKVSEFIREKIRERVDDPETAEKLVPTDYPYGTKRPPLNYKGYYRTFNEDHVRLVDVDENPIERLTPAGVRTADGAEYDLDVVIFATGFDAMTGAFLALDIQGRDGLTLDEKWAAGPRTYLGLCSHDFPNMFMITGPQSPSVLTNMPVAIEHHVEWVTECIDHMLAAGYECIEPTQEAQTEWTAHTNEVGEETLMTEADSWYLGENIPGKNRTFLPYPGGLDVYRDYCHEVVEDDYRGFEMVAEGQELAASDD
jgi:cyclohexanone monooxygenase